MTEGSPRTNRPTTSEVWFDTYLRLHGYTWTPHPDLDISKRPDRLIERDGLRAVCEVKQFDKNPLAWLHETGTAGWVDENKPVRGAVKEAANQLRPLKGRGLPLVVVLANPHGYHIELSGRRVIHAIDGDDSVGINPWLGEGAPPPEFLEQPEFTRFVGRNGQLRASGQYISAVVMLHRRKSDFLDARKEEDVPEEECWVEVIPASSEEAVPLPESFFNGPNDLRRWRYDHESQRWIARE